MNLKFNKNMIRGYIFGFLFLFPIFCIYLYFFNQSMSVAFDRSEYLYIMYHPFNGREEPLLHFLSYFLSYFLENPSLKMLLIQSLFSLLFLATIIKKLKVYNVLGLVKALIFLLICFIVFSNMLGIQLRIGYSVIMFLFVVFFLNKKPNFRNIPYFLLPCLMHSGVVLAILFYYLFYFININTFKKFLCFSLFSIIFSTITIKFLPVFLSILGVSPYYNYYFEDGNDLGRAFPYSVVFYILSIFLYVYVYPKKNLKDFNYFYSLSGFVLIYMGFFLKFYISFKMLLPISAFMYLFILDKVQFNSNSLNIFLIGIITFFPVGFFMLSSQMGLY